MEKEICIFVGIVCLCVALRTIIRKTYFKKKGKFIKAKVFDYYKDVRRGDTIYFPVFSFFYGGKEHTVKSKKYKPYKQYEIGEYAKIYYRLNNERYVYIKEDTRLEVNEVCTLIIGIIGTAVFFLATK